MEHKSFTRPIRVCFTEYGRTRTVADTHEALDCLMYWWPANHGPRHRDALDACLKVLDGHRSMIDAQTAFEAAAMEANLLEQGSSKHR
ncbi:DUF982 domain-containing protein [Mesorhizobium sp. NBSH29]|uniref:DUF982 domain-containing protein n=1 Tax=Mesorhizobium sp. NBSH29 TaxID=2654249 RepID=UPI0018967FFB|nr:DUF982 domain-containing protein [Mesorhizobium sp. NBSH29]QPC86251.1 DUF982 domain-containing protein [Mesorhizobium sp. NBSH29]